MEQLNPANLKFSMMDQAEDSVTFNMITKIAHKQLSKPSTTLNKEHPNRLFKSTFNKLKIPELPLMSPNSLICS